MFLIGTLIVFITPFVYSFQLNRRLHRNVYISLPNNIHKKTYSFNCLYSSFNDRQLDISSMTIDEIKSELDLRNVNYDDCISKSQLVDKLTQSRLKGKADPSIIDQFNSVTKSDIDEFFDDPDMISQMTSKDGKLPGGLPPDVVKALVSDPKIIQMLKDPKMQDVMKAVMTNGPDGLKKYLSDPDAMLLLESLSKAMLKVTDGKI